MTTKWCNFYKNLAQIYLPALATLYFALASIWGLPYVEQVVGTITAIDTFLGVDPYVSGSTEVAGLLTEGVRDWVEAAYTVEKDIDKLGDLMIERIEEKREALGI